MATSPKRLRYSISLVRQGEKRFYTLTMPSDVLFRTCKVTTRKEDPIKGFQRTLDAKRAQEIADYIDKGHGSIPNSIVLSAQAEAELRIIGQSKTVEFNDVAGAFLILDGQHRVYGYGKAKQAFRVPVVIYNDLTRQEETRLFIDINTKQKPVPPALLLDIKKLADIESNSEATLRILFDEFLVSSGSALNGSLSASESNRNSITRVTFNSAVKPILDKMADRDTDEIYQILNNYLTAVRYSLDPKVGIDALSKPVVFRAVIGLFSAVATRVIDKFGPVFTPSHFDEFLSPAFLHMPKKKLEKPGTSWTALRDYLSERVSSRQTI